MAKARKVEVVRGLGQFLDAHHVEVELTEGPAQAKTGKKTVVRFEQAIIAAGSQSVRLPFVPDDPRIFDSTGALELTSIPKRMLVVGGGIIGLEMGTVYSTLGARLDVVEMLDGLMPGADRDLVRVWEKMNKPRFDRIMLKTKTIAVEATKDAVSVTFEGEQAPAGPQRLEGNIHPERQSVRGVGDVRCEGEHPLPGTATQHLRCARHQMNARIARNWTKATRTNKPIVGSPP